MEIGNREIEQIVQQVIANLGVGKAAAGGDYGVFENMSDAIDAAYIAQKDWYENYNVKAREKIIAAIRKVSLEHAEDLSYIPGSVRLRAPLPLSFDQLRDLYRSNESLSAADEEELKN